MLAFIHIQIQPVYKSTISNYVGCILRTSDEFKKYAAQRKNKLS